MKHCANASQAPEASTASAKARAVKEEGTKVAKALFVTSLAACALSIACTDPPEPPREITLVARGMTFVLENGEEPNPVITLRAGERVRLVLENEAPGLLHDVEIPEWGVTVEPIRVGERTDVTFVVPDAPGRYEYRCRPHAEMMHGTVEVTR